jgi:plastocyanin
MTHPRFTRTALVLALVGALTLAASACGSSSGAGSSSSTVTEAAGGGGGATGTPIDVTLKDYSIDVAHTGSLAPGTYTFHVTNNGPSSHNLTVNGPGVSDQATPTFAAGGSMDLTVTLQNGSYELFCSVPSHKQLGMDTHLTVGSGAAAGGGSTKSGGSSSSGSTASGGGWA